MIIDYEIFGSLFRPTRERSQGTWFSVYNAFIMLSVSHLPLFFWLHLIISNSYNYCCVYYQAEEYVTVYHNTLMVHARRSKSQPPDEDIYKRYMHYKEL